MLKTEIRKEYLNKRRQLSDDLYFGLSQSISDQFFFYFHSKLLNINTLHAFLPIEKQREPNTNFIFKILFQRFKKLKIVVPKTNFAQHEMNHFLIDEDTLFQENAMKIPEPISDTIIPESEIDLVLVPLLAFDKTGNRIGYGGGYYDRFLANVKPSCIKVGLSFFDPFDEALAIEPTDIPLDFCVTPNKIWNFSI
jgi:5-formyltetrahydrofolate cyclo-ligase